MPAENDADRASFFYTGDFGAVITVNGGTLNAVFDNGATDVLSIVESTDPYFTCQSSECERLNVRKNDEINIGSDVYRVKKIEHDGTGIATVSLTK